MPLPTAIVAIIAALRDMGVVASSRQWRGYPVNLYQTATTLACLDRHDPVTLKLGLIRASCGLCYARYEEGYGFYDEPIHYSDLDNLVPEKPFKVCIETGEYWR